MANKELFKSIIGKFLPLADATNAEGAPAYVLSAKQKLAQVAATGCLNNTYYASAEEQLTMLLAFANEVDAEFVAKTAIYCRERGYMKDSPSLLAAMLTVRGQEFLAPVFGRVVTNGKILRNFVQIIRSGVVGRKSMGSRPKKLIQTWLNTATEKELLNASIGNDPSLADIVKMVHVKPADAWREAFFAWLINKPYDHAKLPSITQVYEEYKCDRSNAIPDVPFQMLTALELGATDWARIAENGSWQMLRMNLNTFARQGVFTIDGMAAKIAQKLRDPAAIANAKVFPYQLLMAYKATAASATMPAEIKAALQDALDISLVNVPVIEGSVVVCPDVSGSMGSPATGQRGGATSAVRCIDIAALVAAAMLRKNPTTRVLPFENKVVDVVLNSRDSIVTNAEKLAAVGGGGTNCSAPLGTLNREKVIADLVVYVSDNESWIDATRNGATATMREWAEFKKRNPLAKLVCVDIQPNTTTQAGEQGDILNVGGFSDDVFKIIAAFAAGQLSADHWVGEIEAISLHKQ